MIFLFYAVNPFLTIWNYGISPKHPDQVVHQLLEVHQCQGQLTPGLPHHLLHSCGTWPPPPVSHAGIHPGREFPGGGFCWCELWSWKYFNKDFFTLLSNQLHIQQSFPVFFINYGIHRKKRRCTKKDDWMQACHRSEARTLSVCLFTVAAYYTIPINKE